MAEKLYSLYSNSSIIGICGFPKLQFTLKCKCLLHTYVRTYMHVYGIQNQRRVAAEEMQKFAMDCSSRVQFHTYIIKISIHNVCISN